MEGAPGLPGTVPLPVRRRRIEDAQLEARSLPCVTPAVFPLGSGEGWMLLCLCLLNPDFCSVQLLLNHTIQSLSACVSLTLMSLSSTGDALCLESKERRGIQRPAVVPDVSVHPVRSLTLLSRGRFQGKTWPSAELTASRS